MSQLRFKPGTSRSEKKLFYQSYYYGEPIVLQLFVAWQSLIFHPVEKSTTYYLFVTIYINTTARELRRCSVTR